MATPVSQYSLSFNTFLRCYDTEKDCDLGDRIFMDPCLKVLWEPTISAAVDSVFDGKAKIEVTRIDDDDCYGYFDITVSLGLPFDVVSHGKMLNTPSDVFEHLKKTFTKSSRLLPTWTRQMFDKYNGNIKHYRPYRDGKALPKWTDEVLELYKKYNIDKMCVDGEFREIRGEPEDLRNKRWLNLITVRNQTWPESYKTNKCINIWLWFVDDGTPFQVMKLEDLKEEEEEKKKSTSSKKRERSEETALPVPNAKRMHV